MWEFSVCTVSYDLIVLLQSCYFMITSWRCRRKYAASGKVGVQQWKQSIFRRVMSLFWIKRYWSVSLYRGLESLLVAAERKVDIFILTSGMLNSPADVILSSGSTVYWMQFYISILQVRQLSHQLSFPLCPHSWRSSSLFLCPYICGLPKVPWKGLSGFHPDFSRDLLWRCALYLCDDDDYLTDMTYAVHQQRW